MVQGGTVACKGPALPLPGVLTITTTPRCQPKGGEDAPCPPHHTEELRATCLMHHHGSPASLTFTRGHFQGFPSFPRKLLEMFHRSVGWDPCGRCINSPTQRPGCKHSPYHGGFPPVSRATQKNLSCRAWISNSPSSICCTARHSSARCCFGFAAGQKCSAIPCWWDVKAWDAWEARPSPSPWRVMLFPRGRSVAEGWMLCRTLQKAPARVGR